jgi:hypothetical protein
MTIGTGVTDGTNTLNLLTDQLVSDGQVPGISTIVLTSSSTITVTFTEVVKTPAASTADNWTLSGGVGGPTIASVQDISGGSLTQTITISDYAGGQLQLLYTTAGSQDITDISDNTNALATTLATNATDGIAPTLVSAKITGAQEVTLVYSEAVTTLFTDYTLTVAGTVRNITNPVVGSGTKTIILTFDGDAAIKSATGTIDIAATVVDSSSAANALSPLTAEAVTDGQKPTVTSAKITGANEITVVYTEAVTSLSTDYTSLVLAAGGARGVTGISGSGTNTITLTFNGAAAATSDTATMAIGATVVDISNNLNALTAVPAQSVTDGQKPTLVSAKITAADTITVVYSESVTSAAGEYTALGAGLAGKTVSADSGPGVTHTLTLSAGGLAVNATGTMTIGTGVTDGTNTLNLLTDQLVSDGQVPTVSGVTATTADGQYKAGDTIAITVTFTEAVNAIGNPQIELETGVTDRQANYASGSGSTILTFNYIASSTDTSADLDYKATNSLTVGAGSIKDLAGNDATLTLASPGDAGSLRNGKAIVIDTTAPTVALTYSPDSSLTKSSIVTITATFTDTNSIDETPAPTIAITTPGSSGDLAPTTMTKTSNTVWTYGWQVPVNTTDGTATIIIAATDLAQNANATASNNTRTITDTTVPVVNTFTATSTTATSTLLIVTTNESATCAYANTEMAYGSMVAMATTTGVTTHLQPLAGLTSGTSYNYYVRCADPSGNTMVSSAHVGFATLGDTDAPAGLAITTADATINADYYTIGGTITIDTNDVTVQVLNGSDVVGTVAITAGQTAWSAIVALPQAATTTFTARVTDPTSNAALSTSNADSALRSAVITESATAGSDTTAPTAPVITTATSTVNADFYTFAGTVTVDSTSTQTVRVLVGSEVYGTVIVPKNGTTWSVVVALPQSTSTTFKATSADESGNVSSDSNTVVIIESTTAGQGNGTLGVNQVTASSTYATVGGGFDAGWSWIFNVTVPTTEASTTMKFADWVSNGTSTIAAASNIRFYSLQSSNANSTSTAITVSAANTYASYMTLNNDLDASTAGRQIQIIVEAQVPTGSAGGSYSTSYGIKSE